MDRPLKTWHENLPICLELDFVCPEFGIVIGNKSKKKKEEEAGARTQDLSPTTWKQLRLHVDKVRSTNNQTAGEESTN